MKVMAKIGELLDKSRFAEPPEIKLIKDFVLSQFKTEVSVTIHPRTITIGVQSAALAGALRMHLHELQQLCETDKRLVIRIS
jgi:hypothetical protein